MRSKRTAVAMVLVGLVFVSPQILGQSSSAGSARRTPPKASGAQSAALTPEQREAQKHYLIALEALKNNDLDIALKELNSAAALAPRNALIWYNIAVVESKKGMTSGAFEALRKAQEIGLPSKLKTASEDLEVKLAYEREKRKETPKVLLAQTFIISDSCPQYQKAVSDGRDLGELGYDAFVNINSYYRCAWYPEATARKVEPEQLGWFEMTFDEWVDLEFEVVTSGGKYYTSRQTEYLGRGYDNAPSDPNAMFSRIAPNLRAPLVQLMYSAGFRSEI